MSHQTVLQAACMAAFFVLGCLVSQGVTLMSKITPLLAGLLAAVAANAQEIAKIGTEVKGLADKLATADTIDPADVETLNQVAEGLAAQAAALQKVDELIPDEEPPAEPTTEPEPEPTPEG